MTINGYHRTDPLGGLSLDERIDLYDVLAEVDAEGQAGLLPGAEELTYATTPAGRGEEETGLSNVYDTGPIELADVTALADQQVALSSCGRPGTQHPGPALYAQ